MTKLVTKLAIAATVGLLAIGGPANAQQKAGFDGNKFFEELSNRGVNTKGVDGAKFFEELSKRGVNSTAPIDGAKFFEELANRGVKIDGIDGNRLLGELRERGVIMPDMVLVNRPKAIE